MGGSDALRQPCFGGEVIRSIPNLLVFMLGLAIMSGCATQSAPEQETPQPANRYIYITEKNLPDACYRDLGAVKLTRPYAETVVDPDNFQMRKELRAVALSKYPNDVDAVINVKSQQNEVGTQVIVTGEAVRLENRTTTQCALRGVENAVDEMSVVGAGGSAGAAMGGLTGGTSGAASVGVAGAAMMGAYQVIQHEEMKKQQEAQWNQQLNNQLRQITQLQKQRSHLRRCRNADIRYSTCMATMPQGGASPEQTEQGSVTETSGGSTISATPFQIEEQIEEQQDYIKHLQDEISKLEWELSGR